MDNEIGYYDTMVAIVVDYAVIDRSRKDDYTILWLYSERRRGFWCDNGGV